MRPFLLTAVARKDIIDIGRYTTEKWGKRQRDKYLKQLDDAFKMLARQPEIGRDADDVKPGYKKFSQKPQRKSRRCACDCYAGPRSH
ncbi:type II toxin-antitoxin system RelE/ParE family toxin [Spongiibacter nanhainus]|uniref:Type II toxin-antitoxin system RelE/ParE family toxin n=1 Tax=Spongiibacter nanhainus TaxID=2794344 RepID=A0A7T4UQ01_9GAMM|nr:type II toxin-antitoxin system RelE/ParE family toxin [Spongiibacter nanhainus]QQD18216.1 type II toxin-antitoxin system RelE/ParE family toxin [Spongiibacter nanhainus]